MYFIFCVHNHQPVGNFDSVFLRAYEDAYMPFLKAVEKRKWFKFCAHYSGPLLEWIEQNKLEMFILLRKLIDEGRLELISGGFYEPIFTLISEEDLNGQIRLMNSYLAKQFGAKAIGAWMPERVWEQSLVKQLKNAGIEYTILDDFHFKASGLVDNEINGYFITEDMGAAVNLFPIKEDLRYSIPFKDPAWTRDYLKSFKSNNVVVYADDGEKFGVWPDTKAHVWEKRWFENFLDMMERNLDSITFTTFSDVINKIQPKQRIYLPSTSYREMGEWSLLSSGQRSYKELVDKLKEIGAYEHTKQFITGGTWRNFLVKYPESNYMYGRMLQISNSVSSMTKGSNIQKDAQRELYKAQCNCAYWHGVFGGLYLPHLREAVFSHLIRAEKIVEKKNRSFGYKVFDLEQNGKFIIRFYNEHLNVFLSPARGGHITEIDLRDIDLNICFPISRRKELYHQHTEKHEIKESVIKTIHEKRTSLNQVELQFDSYRRESLVDHVSNEDFIDAEYPFSVEQESDNLTAMLTSKGRNIKVTKNLTVYKNSKSIEFSYALEGSSKTSGDLCVEFNFSNLITSYPATFIHNGNFTPLHPIDKRLSLTSESAFCIYDSFRKLNISFRDTKGSMYIVEPLYSTSQNESGYEHIHQSTTVYLKWNFQLEPQKPFVVSFILSFETNVS